jgi:hypothetical protein
MKRERERERETLAIIAECRSCKGLLAEGMGGADNGNLLN